MSLDKWLGKSIPAYTGRALSPVRTSLSQRTVIGVLGTRSTVRYEDMMEQIVNPVLEAWGLPDEILLPAESASSAVLADWAQRREVPVRLLAAEWKEKGARAGSLRDSRIQQEATHLILLQGPRSDKLSALGVRLSKKGRHVVISERPGEAVKAPDDSVKKTDNPK